MPGTTVGDTHRLNSAHQVVDWNRLLGLLACGARGIHAQPCGRCAALPRRVEIHAPGELRHALKVARDKVADAMVRELAPAAGDTSLAELSLSGPWPDVVELRFSCAYCGASFRLAAETCHGSGGAWTWSGLRA